MATEGRVWSLLRNFVVVKKKKGVNMCNIIKTPCVRVPQNQEIQLVVARAREWEE